MTGRLRVAEDRDELRRLAAETIAREIQAAVGARGSCSIALSGGSTPGPAYEELASSDQVPWPALQVFFADERAVPPDHRESNFRLVSGTLLKGHPEARVFRMPADAPDREAAAAAYARQLPDPLDVLVLGMGPDGHIASLFPGSPALDEREKRVVPVTAPKPPPERMTITPPVIERARSIVMIAAGAEKALMVAWAFGGPLDKAVPAQLARRGIWIVDAPAASLISR